MANTPGGIKVAPASPGRGDTVSDSKERSASRGGRWPHEIRSLLRRLHFVGGAAADRSTPTADHWSLAVCDGLAAESEWRAVPLAAMHRASATVEGDLFVFGGQQGDCVARLGSAG